LRDPPLFTFNYISNIIWFVNDLQILVAILPYCSPKYLTSVYSTIRRTSLSRFWHTL
jgi:hypothetical protein